MRNALPYRSIEFAMRHAEVIEVLEEFVDLLAPRFGFQHVLADKVVQPMNVFDGDCLIQHVHRLFFDAGRLAKPVEILGVLCGGPEAASLHFLR
jgi:hypothetical protein